MGATRDDFVKYPRTPHLFGSIGTDDDKHMGEAESQNFVADPALISEEKCDGANSGIHFTQQGRLVMQCRGHEITAGMHPQFDLFKQWISVKRPVLEKMLGCKFILYGSGSTPGTRFTTGAFPTTSSSLISTKRTLALSLTWRAA